MPVLQIGGEGRSQPNPQIGAGTSPVPEEIFQGYPPGQFRIAGRQFAFPVLSVQETGGNRLIERERPYRDGAKLDDTGSKAKRWVIEAIFENTILNPGLTEINQGLNLYPDVLNDLIQIFDQIHETGDLIVPTIGKQRARAESYERLEKFEPRDCAIVRFTWVEDNEDGVDFRTIEAPTANANARRLAETTDFDSQSSGAWDSSLDDLSQFTQDLEDLVNQPGDVSQDVVATSQKIEGNGRRAIRTFSEASKPGRDLFLDAENSRTERKIMRTRDMAGREAAKARRGRPRLVALVFRQDTNIFQIAAFIGQDVVDLIEANPDIDPFFIPTGQQVNVYATEAFLNGSDTNNG